MAWLTFNGQRQRIPQLISMSCGATHIVMVTAKETLVMGCNFYGQAGYLPHLSSTFGFLEEDLIDQPAALSLKLDTVVCGDFHNIGIKDTKVFTWGAGLLGHNSELNESIPHSLPLNAVAAGAYRNTSWIFDDQLYIWGYFFQEGLQKALAPIATNITSPNCFVTDSMLVTWDSCGYSVHGQITRIPMHPYNPVYEKVPLMTRISLPVIQKVVLGGIKDMVAINNALVILHHSGDLEYRLIGSEKGIKLQDIHGFGPVNAIKTNQKLLMIQCLDKLLFWKSVNPIDAVIEKSWFKSRVVKEAQPGCPLVDMILQSPPISLGTFEKLSGFGACWDEPVILQND
jgi:hypothetical protein